MKRRVLKKQMKRILNSSFPAMIKLSALNALMKVSQKSSWIQFDDLPYVRFDRISTTSHKGMVNHRYATLHAIEKALDMLEVWYCQTEDKDDHESSYVIRPAIQKADEALTVIRDELKRELRKAFRMPETKDAAGR